MFKIIRCSSGYSVVILISPSDAEIESPEAIFYRIELGIGHSKVNKISRNQARSYFSGQSDGMGFEILPEDIFGSVEEVISFVREKNKHWAQERLAKETD
ncbi:hypothetical protein ACFL14_02165 [Patescibacteria group bacterium]